MLEKRKIGKSSSKRYVLAPSNSLIHAGSRMFGTAIKNGHAGRRGLGF